MLLVNSISKKNFHLCKALVAVNLKYILAMSHAVLHGWWLVAGGGNKLSKLPRKTTLPLACVNRKI